MKIYTKTGDQGTTALFGGTRVPKHHLRIEAYGTLDELNAHLGLIRDQNIDSHHRDFLIAIQKQLFTAGAVLATDPKKARLKNGKDRLNIKHITDDDVSMLEQEMDLQDTKLPAMTHFILPGGHPAVSYCHVARCICRRAERCATALYEHQPFDQELLRYINRLSDYLFVLARILSQELSVKEVQWISEKV